MKVSVLVPVYRTDRRVLRATIESVLAQSYADFELLLVDDCPEDPRTDVVAEFDDPRIVYRINDRNVGISETRNVLLATARGEYLAILDHDDVCRTDRLQQQVSYLDAHPACGVVSSWVREIPSGKIVEEPISNEAIRLGLMCGCVVYHSAAMVRASVLRDNRIEYEEEFSPSEDYRLWLRLMAVTEFHNLPEPLLDYRLHESNTSKTQGGRMFRMTRRLQEYAAAEYPDLYVAGMNVNDTRIRKRSLVKLLGVPVLSIESSAWSMTLRLFGRIRIASVRISTSL